MYKRSFLIGLMVYVFLVSASYLAAHCEIPCGIYDDQMRVSMIAEHVTTIEKSMNQIIELGGKKTVDYNQITRWVMNKEEHASKIQEIVAQYFMTQRIKPGTDAYMKKITTLHKMLVSAMKCKQTTDLEHVKTLKSLLAEFNNIYFGIGSK